ncbi:MAG: GNAT family N-acetyltransferase [Actinomycetota bacterium]|nr:GNAT family N-acetyltransferase [Actinomycetota bacterium]
MTIELIPATDRDIREFAAWRYDPPYDVYDIDMDPDKAVDYFLEPDVHCHTLHDGTDVAGYCTFGYDARVPGGDYDEAGLDIGLGIEPARTGSGNGHRYVAAVVAHASAIFEPQQLRVTVAAGNKRALRVWSRAGFAEISRFATPRNMMGSNEFVILALNPTPADLRPT